MCRDEGDRRGLCEAPDRSSDQAQCGLLAPDLCKRGGVLEPGAMREPRSAGMPRRSTVVGSRRNTGTTRKQKESAGRRAGARRSSQRLGAAEAVALKYGGGRRRRRREVIETGPRSAAREGSPTGRWKNETRTPGGRSADGGGEAHPDVDFLNFARFLLPTRGRLKSRSAGLASKEWPGAAPCS